MVVPSQPRKCLRNASMKSPYICTGVRPRKRGTLSTLPYQGIGCGDERGWGPAGGKSGIPSASGEVGFRGLGGRERNGRRRAAGRGGSARWDHFSGGVTQRRVAAGSRISTRRDACEARWCLLGRAQPGALAAGISAAHPRLRYSVFRRPDESVKKTSGLVSATSMTQGGSVTVHESLMLQPQEWKDSTTCGGQRRRRG